MRKLYLILIATMSTSLISQEFSEAYLDGLPEDIRKDVMNRVDEKQDLEENVYRSIDTPTDLKKSSTQDLKDRIDDLQKYTADLKSLIDSNVEEIDKKYEIFGSDFFDSIQTTFMPVNAPNLDDSYILDSGDVLNIQLIGQKDSIESYQIIRDGSINIPDIGKLYLSGLSLKQASEMVIAKVNETYIGVEAYISLENIRDVNVLVAGDAFNPGVYTLSGNANLLHAIHAAGGINDYGSYRSIRLIRDEEVIETIDIYDILIEGKFGTNKRIRSGDVIFVDKRANVISLEGAFKRNAKYELKEGQNIYDAIQYANGVIFDADLSNIFLYRILDGEVRDIPITNISQFTNIEAYDLDRVFIRKHSFRDVEISGAVLRPGNYKMVEGDNIFDLVERAGGYTSNAFPEGAIYLNEEAKEINEKASQKLYENFIDGLIELIQKNGGQTDITPLLKIISELKDTEANGRIIIDLMDDSMPTLVRSNDSIFIPEKNNNVFIFGEIASEGSLIYKEGADLDFYLKEASGLKDSADRNSIFILYPNGRTKQFSRKRSVFANQPQNITNIETGSVIYVPRKIDDTLSSTLSAQAYASILGSIGVTLASLSAINNN